MSLTIKGAVKNTAWLAFEQGTRLIGTILVSGLIARQLGPVAFGWLSYAGSIVALLTPIAGLGLNEVIARRIFRSDAAGERNALGTGIRMRLLVGLALWTVVSVVAALLYPESSTAGLVVICSGALAMQAPGVLDAYFQVRLQHGSAVVRRLTGFALTIAVKAVLLIMHAPLWAFALSTTFDVLVASLSLLVAMGPEAREILGQRFSKAEARGLLKLSWPLISSGVLVALYFRIEQFIVLDELGEHDYGIYMAAVRIVSVVNLIIPPMMSSLFPLMAEKVHHEKMMPGQFPPSFVKVLSIFSVGAYGLTILVALGGWVFAELILGPDYAPAKTVLLILPLSIPAIVSGGVRVHYLNLTGQNHLHNWSAVLGLVANSFLAILLVPHFELLGAATATCVGSYIAAIGTSFIFSESRKFGIAQASALEVFRSLRCCFNEYKARYGKKQKLQGPTELL